MLKGAEHHNFMDSDGYMALNGAGKVNLKGQFRMTKRVKYASLSTAYGWHKGMTMTRNSLKHI